MSPWFTIEEIPDVIHRAQQAQLEGIINVCSSPVVDHYKTALKIGTEFEMVYTNLGLQPTEATFSAMELMKEMINKHKNKICGIGEVGLDFYWIKDKKQRILQKKILVEIVRYANEINLPLVIHSRKAEDNCVNILEKYAEVPVLFHGFEGTKVLLKRISDLNYYVSIPSSISIRKKYRRNVMNYPIELLMLETDSPFQLPFTPPQNAERPRNEPSAILSACRKIADLLNLLVEDVAKQTQKNTKEFFKL
jgi:TatD DNase family protein